MNKKYMELKQKVLMFEKREAELLAKENVLLQENEETQRKVGKFFCPKKGEIMKKNVQGKRKKKEVRCTEREEILFPELAKILDSKKKWQ